MARSSINTNSNVIAPLVRAIQFVSQRKLDGPHEAGHDKKGIWVPHDQLRNVALPTVMRKIVEHGLDEGGPLFSSRKP
jgi:hypothetical protein